MLRCGGSAPFPHDAFCASPNPIPTRRVGGGIRAETRRSEHHGGGHRLGRPFDHRVGKQWSK
eukprot:8981346-Alexandrium_andersonii.AAC.1